MNDNETTTKSTILMREDGRQVDSLVLNELDSSALPTSETACQVCHHAVWLEQMEAGRAEPKVFCQLMKTIIWSKAEPVEITNCDGLLIGIEEMDEDELMAME